MLICGNIVAGTCSRLRWICFSTWHYYSAS